MIPKNLRCRTISNAGLSNNQCVCIIAGPNGKNGRYDQVHHHSLQPGWVLCYRHGCWNNNMLLQTQEAKAKTSEVHTETDGVRSVVKARGENSTGEYILQPLLKHHTSCTALLLFDINYLSTTLLKFKIEVGLIFIAFYVLHFTYCSYWCTKLYDMNNYLTTSPLCPRKQSNYISNIVTCLGHQTCSPIDLYSSTDPLHVLTISISTTF